MAHLWIQIVSGIRQSLEIGLVFLYKATWSILFGVLITAIIDVFVDKDKIAKLLGSRSVKATTIATGLGAASSACTFGAVSVSQALFKKGASAESTFAFALASTNIVFELGILIYVILGPAYLVAELVSGVLLVGVMYLIVRFTLPEKVFKEARVRLIQQDEEKQRAMKTTSKSSSDNERLGVWYRIAERYVKTLGRIRNSVLFGFLIAGFIVNLVPTWFWSSIFPRTNSFWGVLGSSALGVVAGVFSFIGSIGIVPFAVALGAGGVAFAGVLGCILSDLITIPVLGTWRKFMGTKATLYIGVVFYIAMVVSSVAIHYLFAAFHFLPGPITSHQISVVSVGFNWTFILTVLMVVLTIVFYWVKRSGLHPKLSSRV